MRGKNFNAGLRGVLFEVRHYDRMGSAIWLYAWLVLRQTHQTGSTGWVLGGAPVSYREIEEETGFNVRTLERWMSTLRRHGYIETQAAPGGLIVRITKAKKYAGTRHSAQPDSTVAARNIAGGVRKFAEERTRICVPRDHKMVEQSQLPPRINSSSVEECIEETASRENVSLHDRRSSEFANLSGNSNQTPNQSESLNPSCLDEEPNHRSRRERPPENDHARDLFADGGRIPRVKEVPPRQSWHVQAEARLLQQRLRAERDEAVRRELRVGRGPELPTPERNNALKTPEVPRT